MRTARYNGLTSSLEFPGELKCRGSKTAEKGDSDQIGLRVKIDKVYLLVKNTHGVLGRGDGSEVDPGDRRNKVFFVTEFIAFDVGDDDVDLHSLLFKSTLKYKVYVSKNRAVKPRCCGQL